MTYQLSMVKRNNELTKIIKIRSTFTSSVKNSLFRFSVFRLLTQLFSEPRRYLRGVSIAGVAATEQHRRGSRPTLHSPILPLT